MTTTPFAESPSLATEVSAEFLATLRIHGVVEAHVFGSVANDTARPDSDLDLLVRFAQPTTLFAQLRLAAKLEQICGRRVDLMTSLHPAFAPYIEPTLISLPI